MPSYDEIKDRVDELLQSRFYEFRVTYAGQIKRDDWDCDAWRVVITGPEKRYMESEYFTGLGHRKSKKPMPADISRLRPGIQYRVQWERDNLKPVTPRAADVLHSLLLDGDAINESFNNWCSNFGYDADSMKAFKTYQACCGIGEKLNKLFPHDLREILRELTQEL